MCDEESGPRQWVYVIGNFDNQLVKIGTTGDLQRRLSQLQHRSPVKLTIKWSTEGGAELETWLHRRFHEYRQHGEWFDFGRKDAVSRRDRCAYSPLTYTGETIRPRQGKSRPICRKEAAYGRTPQGLRHLHRLVTHQLHGHRALLLRLGRHHAAPRGDHRLDQRRDRTPVGVRRAHADRTGRGCLR